MNSYTVTHPDRQAITVEAADWTIGDGLLVFRDRAGVAVTALVVEAGMRIDCTYDPADPVLSLRRELADLQREAERASLAETVEDVKNPKRPTNRSERRSR